MGEILQQIALRPELRQSRRIPGRNAGETLDRAGHPLPDATTIWLSDRLWEPTMPPLDSACAWWR